MSALGTGKTSPMMIAAAVVGVFAAPVIAIALIVQLVLSIQSGHINQDDPKQADQAVTERIKPFAQVAAVDPNAPRVHREGEAVYQHVCATCHDAGALGAPRLGNKGDWAPRIARGYDTLLKHAIEGFKQMPPRGGDPDLSDVEMARVVAYVANKAGANFKAKEPTAEQQAAAKLSEADAQKVYRQNCATCHAAGVAGAPKAGDRKVWLGRLEAGLDALYESALKGKGAMPAKGGNAALPDAAVKAAVDYMLTHSE